MLCRDLAWETTIVDEERRESPVEGLLKETATTQSDSGEISSQ